MVIWAAGLAGVLALVGAWVGHLWERQNTKAHWWRDHRLAAYTDMHATAVSVYESRATTVMTERFNRDHLDQLHSLSRLKSRILLVGPNEMKGTTQDLEDARANLFRFTAEDSSINVVPPPVDDQGTWEDVEDAFLAAARKALDQ